MADLEAERDSFLLEATRDQGEDEMRGRIDGRSAMKDSAYSKDNSFQFNDGASDKKSIGRQSISGSSSGRSSILGSKKKKVF